MRVVIAIASLVSIASGYEVLVGHPSEPNHVGYPVDIGSPEASLATFLLAITPAFSNTLNVGTARRVQDISMKASTKPERVNARNRAYNKMYSSEMKTRMKTVL